MSESVAATEYSPLPSLGRTSMIGAIAGAVDAIAVLILLSPLLLDRVTAHSLDDGTARVDTVFEFSGLEISLPELISLGDITLFEGEWSLTPLFMFSLMAAVGFGLAGMLTVALTRWLPSTVDPSAHTGSPSGRLYLNGLGAGVIIGILAAQFAATWLGADTSIALEIPVFRFLITLVLAGVALGAGVVATSHLMARPDVVGLEGQTWETRSQFYRVLRRAVSVPLTAVAIIAVVVIGFGVLLLAVEEAGKAGPLVLATAVSALILGTASFFAYRK